MKRKIVVIIILLLMGSFAGCTNRDKDKIYGKYKFDKIVYLTIASSSRPDKEKLAKNKYIIESDRFEIVSQGKNYKLLNPIYKKEEMTDEMVQAFIKDVIDTVNISKYKEKYRYTIIEKDNGKINYYLYSMDDELWIAYYKFDIHKEEIWYIYKLK